VRVGSHYLKQIERIHNGGKTEEELREEKERALADTDAQKAKAEKMLMNVMGGGGDDGGGGGDGEDATVTSAADDDTVKTMDTTESHMNKERRKDQER